MAHASFHDYRRFIRGANQLFRLLKCDCINGYAVGLKRANGKPTSNLAIIVYVNQKQPLNRLPLLNRIPESVTVPDDRAKGGVLEFMTDVEEARFIAHQNTGVYRPIPGGVSIGRLDQNSAGTLGGWVYDQDTSRVVMLSNNHVLADTNVGAVGDEVVQPGVVDGGTEVVASLTRWIQIYFEDEVDDQGNPRENLVDAAIATPLSDNLVAWETTHIGSQTPNQIRLLNESDLNLEVQKSGRTTDHTVGFIQALDATVRVKYDLLQKAVFVDQIVISQEPGQPDFSAPGDSGSLIYDIDKQCVGLLFAGSSSTPSSPGTTIANPIRNVYRALHLRSLEAAR